MTDIPIFDFTLPSRRQSQEDFDANFQNLIDRLPSMVNGMNLLASELNALVYATNYNPSTTYNQTGYTRPSAVYGSDGHTYVCIGSNVVGDNPVGSVTGNWLRLTIATSEIVNRTSREIVGGDIAWIAFGESTTTFSPCSCWDETMSVWLQSGSIITGISFGIEPASWMGVKKIADIYFCRKVADGVCEPRMYISGEDSPDDDPEVDAWRWVDFAVMGDPITCYTFFLSSGGYHMNMIPSQSILSANITTTYAEVDHSVAMPIDRISAIEYGCKDAVTAGLVLASDHATASCSFVVGTTITTATDSNQDAWGSSASQKAGLKPFKPHRSFKSTTGTLDLLVQQVVLKR